MTFSILVQGFDHHIFLKASKFSFVMMTVTKWSVNFTSLTSIPFVNVFSYFFKCHFLPLFNKNPEMESYEEFEKILEPCNCFIDSVYTSK